MTFGTAPSEVRLAVSILGGQTGPIPLFRQTLHVAKWCLSSSSASWASAPHLIMNVWSLLEWTMLWTDNGDLVDGADDLCPAVIVFVAVRLARSRKEFVLCQPLHEVRHSEEYNRQRD